jgi:hypothetical protein
MLRALVIRPYWIDLILKGKKTWEIRGSKTAIRGTITLIPSGSGTRRLLKASTMSVGGVRWRSLEVEASTLCQTG